MEMTDANFLLCEICRTRQIWKDDLKNKPIVICESCWGPKRNLIVTEDVAVDLLLAALYAERIFDRACDKWKMSDAEKQMFRNAKDNLMRAKMAWRNERRGSTPVE